MSPTRLAAGPATPSAAPPVTSPTAVKRVHPAPSPTHADPLAPVASKDFPGVVMPAGARRVRFTPASAESDASADFVLPDVANAALAEWFGTQMPKHGWDKGEDLGGALLFLHRTQLSARHASEGLKRTATVLFDPENGGDFTMIVEAPR